jgi:predicted choloylglycine hydrolase
MYEITLKGTPYERGVQQGKAFSRQMGELFNQCSTWLGGLPQGMIEKIRDRMIGAVQIIYPEMITELEGIAAGSGMSFGDVCTLNFVSAIGSLNGCTNIIAIKTDEGPALAKTSDIGDDYAYYCIQRVEPSQKYSYFAISWTGCLWAEVGLNSSGLALGQSSGPIMPGQNGVGIPTLEYPRLILENCSKVEEAIQFCEATPMAGKGLNIAMVDDSGKAAVVEKSGTTTAIRRPNPHNQQAIPGVAFNGVYCTNHFLQPEMQGMKPLEIAGLPNLAENSRHRLANVIHFFESSPSPAISDLIGLINTGIESDGILQTQFPELTTHYAYLLLPAKREMRISKGIPYKDVEFSTIRL